MKLKHLFIPLTLCIFISCSDDDDNAENISYESYFPTKTDNSWTYHNTDEIENQEPVENTETLSISGTSTQQGETYYSFSSDQAPYSRGLTTGTLTNGEVAEINGQLRYNGNLEVDLSMLGIEPVAIPVTNLSIYNQTATQGDVISSISDSYEETIPVEGIDIPFELTYTLEVTQGDFLENYTVDSNETFQDIISSDLSLTIEITASYLTLSVTVMEEQEAVQATNYFAKDVGLIHSEVSTDYTVEDLTDLGLSEMPPFHMLSVQSLQSYEVSLEENEEDSVF